MSCPEKHHTDTGGNGAPPLLPPSTLPAPPHTRSFSKDTLGVSGSPGGLLTPENAGAEFRGGSELAATPDQNATHSSKTSSLSRSTPPEAEEPVISTGSEKMVKADVLTARHAERVLVVGKGVILTANVTSCDKVVVEGQFQGNIKTGTFVLAEGMCALVDVFSVAALSLLVGRETHRREETFFLHFIRLERRIMVVDTHTHTHEGGDPRAVAFAFVGGASVQLFVRWFRFPRPLAYVCTSQKGFM